MTADSRRFELRKGREAGRMAPMHTRIIDTTESNAITQAADLLRRGEVVAFPTETVYGLGANALNASAVTKIFTAKDRPADNPLIVHVVGREMLQQVTASLTPVAKQLISAQWPGPLSLVLPRHDQVPRETTAGLSTVVVREPAHPVARALIATAGVPIAAPSANRSGHVSPSRAAHVANDLTGKIPPILDGGPCTVGLESTVLDVTTTPPTLLRPGPITATTIESIIGHPIQFSGDPTRSPGLRYRHYATTAPIHLYRGPAEQTAAAIAHTLQQAATPARVAYLGHTPLPFFHSRQQLLASEPTSAAAHLYDALRSLDTSTTSQILVQGWPETDQSIALMNRLQKAAASVIEFE